MSVPSIVIEAAIPSKSAISAAAQQSEVDTFDHPSFVWHIDIFLLAFVGVFFIISLPRAFIRFSHRREWWDGHFLRYVDIEQIIRMRPKSVPRLRLPSMAFVSPNSTTWLDSEKQPDLQRNGSSSSQAQLMRNNTTASDRRRRAMTDLPSHMANWTTRLPVLSSLTRIPVRPGLTVGGASILIAYFTLMAYAGLYKSNLLTDPLRTGYLAVSQIPVVVILATKNNVLGMLLGAAYTRLNYLHRFAGRLLILAVNIHAIDYFYKWSLDGVLAESLKKPVPLTGLVGLIAADCLLVFSFEFIRRRFFHTFIVLHVISVIAFFAAVYAHADDALPYLLCGVAAYMFDRLFRLLKTRYTTARLRALPELGMTRVEINGVNAGWRAGQHVRLRVLEGGLGPIGWLEAHPFTVASVAKSPSEEGLILMCKKTGTWTNKLFDLAKRREYSEVGGVGRDVRVLVEGPYGGPGHTVYTSFSGALVVAGGSGITFALGMVQDLLQRDREGKSRLKCIELVWSVQDPTAILPLLGLFNQLLRQSTSKRYYTSLQVTICYTRCFANPPPHVLKVLQTELPLGLRVTPGRPKLQSTLNSVVDRACQLFHGGKEDQGAPAGVLVTVCGPQGLAEDVRKAVRGVEPQRRRRAGGVELHDEVFGG
ncbi:incomplete iron reductase [Irpex rosettiformis]|uniref:Incomplete iron reductase n=1 Tax=Irpex rosettiformis TaxID=378272 RepID=A0ACB8TSE9_9APHY|nr:incomplete iron reductase [Irpex rosettiformis]